MFSRRLLNTKRKIRLVTRMSFSINQKMNKRLQLIATSAEPVFKKYAPIKRVQVVVPSVYERPEHIIFITEYNGKLPTDDYFLLQDELEQALPNSAVSYLGDDASPVDGEEELGERRFRRVWIYPQYEPPSVVPDIRDEDDL